VAVRPSTKLTVMLPCATTMVWMPALLMPTVKVVPRAPARTRAVRML
jgi:hypothetical protein